MVNPVEILGHPGILEPCCRQQNPVQGCLLDPIVSRHRLVPLSYPASLCLPLIGDLQIWWACVAGAPCLSGGLCGQNVCKTGYSSDRPALMCAARSAAGSYCLSTSLAPAEGWQRIQHLTRYAITEILAEARYSVHALGGHLRGTCSQVTLQQELLTCWLRIAVTQSRDQQHFRPLLLYLCTARTSFLHFFIGCSLVGEASGRQSGC